MKHIEERPTSASFSLHARGQPHIGSLCTGYGGLDIAALAVFGGTLVWCADNGKHVTTILAARYPDVPNLGDLTALNWNEVAPVDIMCAGFPCQDISFSGRGAGIEKGVRSGIWKNIVVGIRELRPAVIVVENVAAIRSRGLGRVLGDLASLGYDASWTSVRASDVGAAHRRERVFILAYRQDKKAIDLLALAHARGERWQRRAARGQTASGRPSGGFIRPDDFALATAVEQPRSARRQASSIGEIVWGRYGPAIWLWEAVTGRAAPYPVERGTRGQPRLAAAFSEWLMGLPKSFVTGLNLPYNAEHRLLGNGYSKGLLTVSIGLLGPAVGAGYGGYGPVFVVVARKAVVDHFFVSAAKVRRYFVPPAGIELDGVAIVERAGALAEGTPFFAGPGMLPAEPLCSFFFELSKSLQPSTLADYAYDLMDLVSFLGELDPPADLLSATENDLIAYREACTLRGTRPLSAATWHRRRAAINNFYGWAVDAGLLERRPYFRRANGRDSLGWGSMLDLDVRCLTFDQWRWLKQVGLRGESPDGAVDESFRGADPLRNSAAAELAVTTGMRLREFTSLLDIEVPRPRPDGSPHRLRLQAIAKYQLPRDVLVQHPTLREIELYRRTERAAAVRRSASVPARDRDELFVVDEVDTGRMRLSGRLWGRRRSFAVHLLPPGLRRIAFIDGERGLEPMALFVGRGGRMLSKQRWEQIFTAGFARASRIAVDEGSVAMPRRFRIHDLRHTFAVLMLRELTRLVVERETQRRRAGGHGGYLSEHIAGNPLLIVQRLLGHRQPSSTMRYLSYLDETDELVAKAIAQWNAHDTTWADYAAALTEQGVR